MGILEKEIPGYEGLYSCNTDGEIISLNRKTKDGKTLKRKKLNGWFLRDTYRMCILTDSNGKKRKWLVHVLIALTFIGDSNGLDVNHIDGDKKNNRLSNLEYCTRSENLKHAFRLGLRSLKGENHNQSKLTIDQVREIKKLVSEGLLTHKEIALFYNVHKSTISAIINGRNWNYDFE